MEIPAYMCLFFCRKIQQRLFQLTTIGSLGIVILIRYCPHVNYVF